MAQLALRHVNVIVTDLPRSIEFYQKLLGLTMIERPPFKNAGAWPACGALQGAFVTLSSRSLPDRQRRRCR